MSTTTTRRGHVFNVIQALLRLGVLTQEEAKHKLDELYKHYDDFGVYVTIRGIEYNITGMALGSFILQIEEFKEIEEGEKENIVNMRTIEEFKEWVKDRLAVASASVDDQ